MRAGPAVQPAQAVITVRSLTYYYRLDARVVWCGVVWCGVVWGDSHHYELSNRAKSK